LAPERRNRRPSLAGDRRPSRKAPEERRSLQSLLEVIKPGAPGLSRLDQFTARALELGTYAGGHMALYTVHVSGPSTSTQRGDSLNAIRAYYKVRQLRTK